jgi:hypothetical protein
MQTFNKGHFFLTPFFQNIVVLQPYGNQSSHWRKRRRIIKLGTIRRFYVATLSIWQPVFNFNWEAHAICQGQLKGPLISNSEDVKGRKESDVLNIKNLVKSGNINYIDIV